MGYSIILRDDGHPGGVVARCWPAQSVLAALACITVGLGCRDANPVYGLEGELLDPDAAAVDGRGGADHTAADTPWQPDVNPIRADAAVLPVDVVIADASAAPDTGSRDTSTSDMRGVDDGSTDVGIAATPPDYCKALPALTIAPTLDGVIDGALVLHPLPESAWYPIRSPQAPAEERAAIAAAWRPDGLYVFARVTDPNVVATRSSAFYCEDAVEVFFDGDGRYTSAPRYDDPGTRQFVVAAPRGSSPEGRAEVYREAERLGLASATLFRSTPIPGGYAVEGFVPLMALGLGSTAKLAAGGRVGLDFQINVARQSNAGTESSCQSLLPGVYILRLGGTGCGRPACDVGAFCTPVLEPPR